MGARPAIFSTAAVEAVPTAGATANNCTGTSTTGSVGLRGSVASTITTGSVYSTDSVATSGGIGNVCSTDSVATSGGIVTANGEISTSTTAGSVASPGSVGPTRSVATAIHGTGTITSGSVCNTGIVATESNKKNSRE